MTPSYELQLMALAVPLYVYDCGVLLYADAGRLIGVRAWPHRGSARRTEWRWAALRAGLETQLGRLGALESALPESEV